MKWFKHLSGSLKDSVIFEAIEIFGSDAYLVFFGTLELMSDEFDVFNPGTVTLSIKKMTTLFQLSRQKTVRILEHFDQIANKTTREKVSFLVSINKNHVVINCHKLAMLCDNHTQKLLRDTSKSIQSNYEATSIQEAEAEEEEDKEAKEKAGFTRPSLDEIINSSSPKIKKDLESICFELFQSKKFTNVYAFTNKALKERKNPRAILHALGKCMIAELKGDPYGYCTKILKIENGNYNEKDSLR